MPDRFVLIMAGGTGSRFWPISRLSKPKQFLDLLGTGQTLLQHTYNRFSAVVKPENIFVVSHAEYAPMVRGQLPQLGNDQLILEPAHKNTAPAALYSLHIIQRINPEAVITFTPADHLVLSQDLFEKAIIQSFDYARNNPDFVTLGIQPTRAEIGFNYIQYINDEPVANNVFSIKTFTEYPTPEIAETFYKSGDFLWNTGVVTAKMDTVMAAFQENLPEMYALFKDGENEINSEREHEFVKKIYPMCENVSLKDAVLYKAKNSYVLKSNIVWSNVGNWNTLWDIHAKDYVGNAVTGNKVMMYNADNNLVKVPDSKVVVIEGLENYLILDNGESILICPKNTPHLKQMLADIKRNSGDKYL